MKLVVITKKYDSTVTKTKVHPTPLNADGIPMYVIGLSDERAQQLIDAGVAEEYITEEITTSSDDVSIDSNEESTVVDTNTDELDANDDDTSSADSNDDASSNVDQEETPKETKSNSRSKKNKSK